MLRSIGDSSVVKFVELGGKTLCVCHATRVEKDVTILSLIGSDPYLINQSVSTFEFELSQRSALGA